VSTPAVADQPADFAADSAVAVLGAGRWGGRVTDAWSAPPGPNGGYVAALILRAIQGEVADRERQPRALTVHYLRPPEIGEVEISVSVERSGRSASTCSVRLIQSGKLRAIALCVLSGDYPSALEWSTPPPDAPRPEQIEPLPAPSGPIAPQIFGQLEFRPAFGAAPFSGADQALVGGWARTRHPVPADQELLCLYADAWLPAAFPRLDGPCLAPTLDLTIHFRSQPPTGDRAQVLGRFSSSSSADGFFEEDGALWSEEGVLLAQSRQLALIRPLPP
jgi:acyl-CoA thioesterase